MAGASHREIVVVMDRVFFQRCRGSREDGDPGWSSFVE